MAVIEPGDVIQIELDHKWQACLAVVDEVRPWGVLAYVLIPENDGRVPGAAFIRLKTGEFISLGVKAAIVAWPPSETQKGG